MSTEVVVEIDEGCMRKARLAPAYSRELAQPRARKRVTRRRPRVLVTATAPRAGCHALTGARSENGFGISGAYSSLPHGIFLHEHHNREALVGKFVQGVGGGVYLVVIRAVGERGVLLDPLREPRRRSGELHLARLE